MSLPRTQPAPASAAVVPLYAAGFTTAFGAHSIAAGLGATNFAEHRDVGADLLVLGVLLALYDVAEVFLKPVFGSLSDRIGPKPVIIGGLMGFTLASLAGLWSGQVVMLAVARLGQGAAASAFSPASSASVARLAGKSTGRYFGRYGSWKGLGYAFGPLLGAGAILVGGFPLLFGVLAALALAVAVWVSAAVPRLDPLPRTRYTVADLARQLTDRSFLGPTLVLAGATGALGAAVGFLPALAIRAGMGTVASVGAVTVLAVASSLVQPRIGRLRDAGRIQDRAGMAGGLGVIATGALVASFTPLAPGAWAAVTVYLAALLVGAGIGVATPVAFAHLADATPHERMGRTMGTAELGRELGDAGGPLLVGAVASGAGIGWGLGALAVAVGAIAASAPTGSAPTAAAGSEDPERRP
ncbi:MFS transporter [Sinomonas sp. ASV322]|uniref:MFS transporter n=1 Tax=Sinomonas sp. ASV322 TaxID=3041920 RepID=UPI0027DE5CFF|nr:MFS transporter [Sinomonas sp. ASV322]MDQ4504196.1 MFS transporter [Sinomonas sp. ASV322]